MTKRRTQKRTIYERSGLFYVRYYTRDVEDKPVQASHRLDYEKDDKHFSPTCKAVKDLRDKFMTQINSSVRPVRNVLINDYLERDLPALCERALSPVNRERIRAALGERAAKSERNTGNGQHRRYPEQFGSLRRDALLFVISGCSVETWKAITLITGSSFLLLRRERTANAHLAYTSRFYQLWNLWLRASSPPTRPGR